MSHGRNKFQSRENRARVRALLFREWDPIGVYPEPRAADEYDAYADRAYVMLMDENATAREIADYLYWIATVHMGLGRSDELSERTDAVAERLVAMRPEFELH